MRHLPALLLLYLSALPATACKCASQSQSFSARLSYASQVFTGRAIRVNAEKSRCLFKILQPFKGITSDTLTIYSAPTSCRVSFEQGLTYVVFSSANQVQRCSGSSTPIAESTDLGKLYYTFQRSFADSLCRDKVPLLNHSEGTYFNSELQNQRGSFSFQDKQVAFFYNAEQTNKQHYVREWAGHNVVSELLVLTPVEKQRAGGYDAIIVVWRKQGISQSYRRRLIRRLGRPS